MRDVRSSGAAVTGAQSPSLTEFLSARLDEDEADARAVLDADDAYMPPDIIASPRRILVVDPVRVLADVEAKRAIIEWHDGEHICDNEPCAVFRGLASVYHDHPDFDPGWLT